MQKCHHCKQKPFKHATWSRGRADNCHLNISETANVMVRPTKEVRTTTLAALPLLFLFFQRDFTQKCIPLTSAQEKLLVIGENTVTAQILNAEVLLI